MSKRTIKFRGKRVDNGEWVYGYLFKDTEMTDRIFILCHLCHDEADDFGSDKRNLDIQGYEVHPETVGQFTGLKDKNGKEIYEGDVLKIFVKRDNYDHHKNINHKGFYLNCEVKDIRGNIGFSKKEIKKLEQPIGKEITTQYVGHDWNLFDPHYCKRIVEDKDGKPVIDENDSCKNYKRYLDIEIIGSIHSNPELLEKP